MIARTFLALNEKVKLLDEDRKLLLVALFRDSSVCLVKDDGGLYLFDMIMMK